LRREFHKWQSWQRAISATGRNVLITLGGTDPDNTTSSVLEALNLFEDTALDVTVVAGGSNPHFASLARVAEQSKTNVRLLHQTDDMPSLMAWADVAVAGAGATCWEMCLLGLPALLMDLAPNQLPIARELQLIGAAIHLGTAREVSASKIRQVLYSTLQSREARTAMSQTGRKLVDGNGARRVVNILGNQTTSGIAR
jgi:UDP-2,4-diacetamido-2,4,6-trideoxy-beta-L-altropyranose hydrolase